eukprot:6600123-Alexandrium_andersonii.AAC.1
MARGPEHPTGRQRTGCAGQEPRARPTVPTAGHTSGCTGCCRMGPPRCLANGSPRQSSQGPARRSPVGSPWSCPSVGMCWAPTKLRP